MFRGMISLQIRLVQPKQTTALVCPNAWLGLNMIWSGVWGIRSAPTSPSTSFCSMLFVDLGTRPLFSGWLVDTIPVGGRGGAEGGSVDLSGFPLVLGTVQADSPLPWGGGGCQLFWVGPWAEAHCDTWGCCHVVQTCFLLQFCHAATTNVNVG